MPGALYIFREPISKALNMRQFKISFYLLTAAAVAGIANFRALRGECKQRSLAEIETLIEKV